MPAAGPGDRLAQRADPPGGARRASTRRPTYRALFGGALPDVAAGRADHFSMFGQAIAEFEFTLIFADAPIDRFARGDRTAMSDRAEAGRAALLRQGRVRRGAMPWRGPSNEMFSDFQDARRSACRRSRRSSAWARATSSFDGPGADEDFGLEEFTGDPADRYKFRTSPLRNVALQPAFFHNGASPGWRMPICHHLRRVRIGTKLRSNPGGSR